MKKYPDNRHINGQHIHEKELHCNQRYANSNCSEIQFYIHHIRTKWNTEQCVDMRQVDRVSQT